MKLSNATMLNGNLLLEEEVEVDSYGFLTAIMWFLILLTLAGELLVPLWQFMQVQLCCFLIL